MTDHAKTAHSIWLCPEPGCRRELRDSVQTLARLSGTATFEPHVTLLGDLQGDAEETLEVCRTVLNELGPIQAQVTALSRSSAYYMSFFLDLQLVPDLSTLRSKLKQDLSAIMQDVFRPHLSLAYGLPATQPDASVAQALEDTWAGSCIWLTELAVVASAQSVPLDQWQTLFRIPLKNH